MIRPLQKDEQLLADIRSADPSPDRIDVWWLGQSGFLVRWNGFGLLFDPYLSDSLTRKYAQTDKPHVRLADRVVDPLLLRGLVDVSTSSHNHTDHLDAETLLPLQEVNPNLKLVLPRANVEFARNRLGAEGPALVALDRSEELPVGPLTFRGVAAAHNELAFDEEGRSHYLGFTVQLGPFVLYHSGDTLWHETLVEEIQPRPIDIAFLPINGNKPERRVAGNLNGTQAAALGKAIGARTVIPCHFHLFAFNTEEPDEFIASCQRLEQPFQVLQNGERLSLQPLSPGTGTSPD